MSAVRIVAPITLLFLAISSSAAAARDWKDSTGQISRAGDFVAYRDGRVIVRLPDGRETSTALEQFSGADQAYVRDLANAKTERAAVPARLAAQTVQTRTANYETPDAPTTRLAQAPQPAPPVAPAASAPPAAAKSDRRSRDERSGYGEYGPKRVFYADCGTFHIIRGEPGFEPIIGTAHYSMPYWWPPSCCCCCCCPCTGPWYLVFLKETYFSWPWLWCDEVSGTHPSSPIHWAISYAPGHPIWWFDSGWNPHFFGHASWTHPK